MENFSTILQTVWRPAQKNSWGGLHQPPPDRARVKAVASHPSPHLYPTDGDGAPLKCTRRVRAGSPPEDGDRPLFVSRLRAPCRP